MYIVFVWEAWPDWLRVEAAVGVIVAEGPMSPRYTAETA